MDNWEKDFKEKPVSPREFLCNKFLEEDFLETLNNWTKSSFIKIFNKDDPSDVYILKNKEHIGKSTLIILCNIYILYLFNLLKNPMEYFQMPNNTKFSILLGSSKKVDLGKFIKFSVDKYSKKDINDLIYINVENPVDLIRINPIFALGNLDTFEKEEDFFNMLKDIINILYSRKIKCNRNNFFKLILECAISDNDLISNWPKDISNLKNKSISIKFI